VIRFKILHPLNFSAMTEDRIVKFYARVGPRNISRVMTNYPPRGSGHARSREVLIYWQISVNISKTVQDGYILTMED